MLSGPDAAGGTAPALAGLAVDGVAPGAEARPTDVASVAAAVAAAAREGLALVPRGGGTHLALGNAPARHDLALRLDGLAAVRDHAPADLTLTVEAGATLAAVQRFLAPHGQFLPLDAEDPERATIGGLLAAGVSGPWRAGHGTARDHLLWTEVVGADGVLSQAGARVVKSVAGYDLPKLHVGAVGGLGVITAACFKLQPIPASRRLLLAAVAEAGALGPLLAALDAAALQPSVFGVAAGPAAWGGPHALGPWVVAFGAAGREAATAWQAERAAAIATAHGAALTLHAGEAAEAARQALMARRAEGAVRLRLVVLPDRLPALLEQLAHLAPAPLAVHAEAANGVARVAWAAAGDAAADGAWRDAGAIAEALGGHWLLEACPPAWKASGLDVWGPPRPDRPLMARLKRALDPKGTLGPGRGIGG